MAANTKSTPSETAAVHELAEVLAEVTGNDARAILSEMAKSPSHDVGVPSPQAIAVLAKLKTRHGFSVSQREIAKTKKGSCCSMSLLAELLRSKIGAK